MRAISQRTFGGPAVLEPVEVDRPDIGPDDVLIRVGAASVNPADWKIRSGQPPLLGDPPFILGFDLAGVVEVTGSRVSRFRPGDRVHGMPSPPAAAYAEYVRARADELAAIPAQLDSASAAALPAVGLTAWQALVTIGRVGSGQRVLIHAAAGGVGHLAVQIAKAHGAYVVATARSDNHEFLRDLGADELIDYPTQDFTTAVRDIDTVLDLVGGGYGPRSLHVLKPGGLLVTAMWTDPGLAASEVERSGRRYAEVQVKPSADDLERLDELVRQRLVRVHVDLTLSLDEVGKAHRISESGRVRGKLVLIP